LTQQQQQTADSVPAHVTVKKVFSIQSNANIVVLLRSHKQNSQHNLIYMGREQAGAPKQAQEAATHIIHNLKQHKPQWVGPPLTEGF
jgi:hypothetical protein